MRSATEHAEGILAMVGPLNRAIQAAEDDGFRVKLDGELELTILMGKVGAVVVSAETKAKVTAPEDTGAGGRYAQVPAGAIS